LLLTVEWSSAQPIREARRDLQQQLNVPEGNGEYVISVRQLPPEVQNASATLTRIGHPQIRASHTEHTMEADLQVVSCYFAAADPITNRDQQVTFQFQAAGLDLAALFSIPEMRFHGALAL
jgi:hypothetical protein